ncbi:hypothetical protein [uncultured Psychroserpens sp.]|uniref:hypothetical protein n=1 Tax=uncultured Psychroserpens sp. TaxID=255436 RepID=UPI00261FECD7|nr:hypothetical protein [uncultured Psychroserpens sp.]
MNFGFKKYDKVLLFFFVAFISASSLIWLFEERFNEKEWRSNPTMRYKMCEDIVDNELLLGKTDVEVISLLGEPDLFSSEQNFQMIYEVGKGPSFFESEEDQLIVIFENSRVVKAIYAED